MAVSEDVQGFCCSSLWWVPVRVHYIGCTLGLPASAQLARATHMVSAQAESCNKDFQREVSEAAVCMAGELRCCVVFSRVHTVEVPERREGFCHPWFHPYGQGQFLPAMTVHLTRCRYSLLTSL